MRIVNLIVIGALIFAASVVYKIKFDSTLQFERAAKIRSEIRVERDAIATLRADWARLETPARIDALAKRYLQLKPMQPTQVEDFSRLPMRPVAVPPPPAELNAMGADNSIATGSVPSATVTP